MAHVETQWQMAQVFADVGVHQLAAMGVAGAWRLGRWSLLASYLDSLSCKLEGLSADEIWELRIGQLLSSVSKRLAARYLASVVRVMCVGGRGGGQHKLPFSDLSNHRVCLRASHTC